MKLSSIRLENLVLSRSSSDVDSNRSETWFDRDENELSILSELWCERRKAGYRVNARFERSELSVDESDASWFGKLRSDGRGSESRDERYDGVEACERTSDRTLSDSAVERSRDDRVGTGAVSDAILTVVESELSTAKGASDVQSEGGE